MPRSTAIVGRKVDRETISRRFVNARRGVVMGKRVGKSVEKMVQASEWPQLFSGFRRATRGTVSRYSFLAGIVQFVAAFREDS